MKVCFMEMIFKRLGENSRLVGTELISLISPLSDLGAEHLKHSSRRLKFCIPHCKGKADAL